MYMSNRQGMCNVQVRMHVQLWNRYTIFYGLYYVLAGQWILTFFLGNSLLFFFNDFYTLSNNAQKFVGSSFRITEWESAAPKTLRNELLFLSFKLECSYIHSTNWIGWECVSISTNFQQYCSILTCSMIIRMPHTPYYPYFVIVHLFPENK